MICEEVLGNLNGRLDDRKEVDYVDIELLQEHLGDEYILIVKTDEPNLISAYAECENEFSVLLNDDISAREAVVASDIIIGDYCSQTIEAVITDKPVIFTGIYESEKCALYGADIITQIGAKVAYDTSELIAEISSVDNFENKVYDKFKQKYFNGVSGKSSENIIDCLK